MKQRDIGSLLDSVREAMGATRVRHPLGKLTAAGVGALTPLMAFANPTGGQVAAGAASITTPSGNRMVIDQTSQNAVINWQQFSVGAHQYVQFVQPNSSSVVLNRVISNDPSRIFGNISANGQVFLVNPNGVFFAPGSSLDAAGILVSTLDIKNNDFMQGNYVFAKGTDAPDATIINQGSMSATRNGYVVLSGDYVENDGRIQAQTGRVYLAAGANATLTFDSHNLISYTVDGATLARLAGAVNAGDIVATGGAVVMTGDVANALTATAVNNQGFIAARSIQNHGGTIVLEATGGELINSGTLDASANQSGVAGGTVIVHAMGGDTKLTPDSVIDVSGEGANGGFIDVSGHEITIKGQIEGGKGAKLLLDPSTITIEGSGSSTGAGCSGCEGGVIHTKFIQSELNAGFDLTIVASNQIILGSGARGALFPTVINAGGAGKLALKIGHASGTIGGSLHRITSSIFDNQGSLSEHFVPGTGGTINLTGLNISIKGAFQASASHGNVTLGNVTAGGIHITGSKITTGALHATGLSGNLVIVATGSPSSNAFIKTKGLTVDSGHMALLASGGGASISVAGNISVPHGSLSTFHAHSLNNSSGAKIKVTGNIAATDVIMQANGGGVSDSVIVTGGITTTANGSGATARLSASNTNVGSGNAKIQVGGTINSNKSVTLTARASNANAAPLVSVAAINADKTPCTIIDCTAGNIAITANKGTIKANGNLNAGSGTVLPASVTLSGRNISFGNISAPGKIDITAQSISSIGVNGITQRAGTTLKARVIDVALNASYGGAIVLANLDASSAAAPAMIQVDAISHNRSASLTVNGNITVNGKAESSFSSAMPGFGIPYGARLQLTAGGSSAAAAYTVKVNGSITLNAVAGTVHETSSCGECGPNNSRSFINGTGGKAFVNMSAQGAHGSVAVTGPMSVTGPEAFVQMNAVTLKTGAISVTGKGQTLVYSNSFGHVFSHGGTTQTPIGQAGVFLGSNGSAVNVTTGNITVQGKGWARVSVRGSNVTAGNIAIAASAAKTTRTGSSAAFGGHNSSQQFGAFGLALDKGTMSIGLAELTIGSHSNPAKVKNLTLGNVSVTGVGEADILLAATSIKTQGLNALATKGTMVGNGTSASGTSQFKHTFTVNGGQAAIELDTGLASAGAIAITGNVNASGPTAGVTLSGHSVKVSGNVGAVASGGAMTSDVVVTGGSNYHTHFTGPGKPTTVTIGDSVSSVASIAIGGIVSVKGPGLVGIHIAGDKVTLGGLSASAAVAAAYSVLDTRVSATADNFTVGSAAVLVDATSANGGFLPATVNGNVTINAPHGNIFLPSQLNVTGQVKLTALGNISTNGTVTGQRFNAIGNVVGNHNGSNGSSGSSGAPKGASQPLAIKAGSVIMAAGGSVNVAGTINAGALAVIAGKNIAMSGTQLTIGNGSISSVHGDAELLLGLALAGIAPAASNPNGAFIAGGSVSLGGLKLTGSYLLLQGTAVSILGPVSVPAGTLVQVVPFDTTESMDIENAPAASSVLTLAATSSGFFLTNQGFISLFSGDTVAVGNADETGNVTLGTNGPIDIGDTNLIIDTTGTITGLSTVTSTGIVSSLISILGPPVVPPTAGEIDPNSGNTTPPNKKNGADADATDTGGGTGGTITQDTGTASVCH